jgi:bifunctional DNA primase/polymerase-like protein
MPKGKKPVPGFKWEALQRTLPTQEQVKSWFEGTNRNIAVVTGAVSRLLAFDIDGGVAKSHADDIIQNRIRQDTRDAIAEAAQGGLQINIHLEYIFDKLIQRAIEFYQ